MRYFRYKTQDRLGTIKRGLRKADRAEIILEELQKQGLKVINIRTVGFFELLYYKIATVIYEVKYEGKLKSLLKHQQRFQTKFLEKAAVFRPPGRVRRESVLNFTRELCALLRAGVPLEKALSVVADSEDESSSLQGVLYAVISDIRGGTSFSHALAKHPRVFPPEYSGLVKVGEETGKIADVLDTLAAELDRGYRLQKRVQSAFVYPAFVMVVSLMSVFGIFLFVFPQIAQILGEMKLNLPVYTRMLLFTVKTLTNPYIIIIIITFIVMVIFLMRSYLNTPVGQYYAQAIKFSIPVLGALNNWLFSEKFCRIMAMFYKYGVPVHISLGMMRDIFQNTYIDDHLFSKLQTSVMEGDDLDVVMKSTPILPTIVSNLVAVGSETGEMTACFHKAADMFELEIDQMIQKLVAMIDPFIVSALGLFIFFIVISIFIPLYQAITSLGQ